MILTITNIHSQELRAQQGDDVKRASDLPHYYVTDGEGGLRLQEGGEDGLPGAEEGGQSAEEGGQEGAGAAEEGNDQAEEAQALGRTVITNNNLVVCFVLEVKKQ